MENVSFRNNIDCYFGDCTELFQTIKDKSVDFILTDIPYELNTVGGGCGFDGGRTKYESNEQSSLFFISHGIDYDKIFSEFLRVMKKPNICIFCSNLQISKIMSWWENKGLSVTLLVWDKPNPIPFGNKQYINNLEFIVYVRGKGATFNILAYDKRFKSFKYASLSAKVRIHETEKPQKLLSHLLSIHTKENDLVLDPYSGSFSTAIACYNGNRRFIGCEIDKDIFNNAMTRLKQVTAQLSLF